MTGICRAGVPLRRGLNASTEARPAAIGSRDSACLRSRICSVSGGVRSKTSVCLPCSSLSGSGGTVWANAGRARPATSVTITKRLRTRVIRTSFKFELSKYAATNCRESSRFQLDNFMADDLLLPHEVPVARVPLSTYRQQFHSGFTFRDARASVEYLCDFGVSDCYASSYLKAVPASPHGYDVADPTCLNPEIGTDEDYWAWIEALRRRGMGHVMDLVPNHMGIAKSANPWWVDVLENGPSSRFARFFDIEWHPVKGELADKILIPILGDQYGAVLERQELQLAYRDGTFCVRHHDDTLPIAPDTYAPVLDGTIDRWL